MVEGRGVEERWGLLGTIDMDAVGVVVINVEKLQFIDELPVAS